MIVPLKTRIGRRAAVELADGAHQVDARREREAQVEDEQVELLEVGADAAEQFGGALGGDGSVAGFLQGSLEPFAHERRVVGDQDGLGCRNP